MTKAETLTEAIAGHDVATFEETPDGLRAKCNRCDERLEDGHAYVFDACRAHVAAVALAWLEGHGWAEGAWQYGVLWDGAGPDGVLDMDDEAMACEVMPDGVVRRIVGAWAPVETGEAHR